MLQPISFLWRNRLALQDSTVGLRRSACPFSRQASRITVPLLFPPARLAGC